MSTELTTNAVGFDDPHLFVRLDALSATPDAYDALDFGLVVMDLNGIVRHYNVTESRLAGIPARYVIGVPFFTDVAPCTDNLLVAGRFAEAAVLDATIDYVFTFRMRPQAVRLRMLKNEPCGRQYLAVAR